MMETTPDLLTAGDTILGARDGQPWLVAEVTEAAVVLEREGKRHQVPKERLPRRLTLVESARQAEDRARALLQVRLGAEVVAVRQPDGTYRVAASFPDLGALLSHLYLLHAGGPHKDQTHTHPQGSLAEVLAHHDRLHADTPAAVDHEHSASFHSDLAGS